MRGKGEEGNHASISASTSQVVLRRVVLTGPFKMREKVFTNQELINTCFSKLKASLCFQGNQSLLKFILGIVLPTSQTPIIFIHYTELIETGEGEECGVSVSKSLTQNGRHMHEYGVGERRASKIADSEVRFRISSLTGKPRNENVKLTPRRQRIFFTISPRAKNTLISYFRLEHCSPFTVQ